MFGAVFGAVFGGFPNPPFRWMFGAVFGAVFGGFPNPPQRGYQLLQMRQFLLFSLSSQKNYKFIYSFFGGLQLLFPLASDRWFHRTSAAIGKMCLHAH